MLARRVLGSRGWANAVAASLMLLLGTAEVSAQAVNCPATDYELNSQAEVDAIAVARCTSITGGLSIVYSTDIQNLNGLSRITDIKGNLTIDDNDALTSLNGLSSLVSVGGDLKIASHNVLTNLNGMSALKTVGGHLIIAANNALQDINGLAQLESVGKDLYIYNNDKLANLSGVPLLTSVGEDLIIGGNEILASVQGFAGLVSVGKDLLVRNNPSLTDVGGLAALTTVSGHFSLSNNDSMRTLTGMPLLASVGGDLLIRDNSVLVGLPGLTSLAGVGAELYVGWNPSLQILPFAALKTVGTDLFIYSNQRLASVTGFSALSSIGEDLVVRDNPLLPDLTGFSGLTSIAGDLFIYNNDALQTLQGLSSVKTVAKDLVIRDNAVLLDVAALSNLTTVGEDLTVEGNDSLMDVMGFVLLTSIGEDLTLRGNASLNSLTGLRGLSTVEKDVIIEATALADVDALTSLSEIKGDLRIDNNRLLMDVNGFTNVATIARDLFIANNPALFDIDGLASLTNIGGDLDVVNNGLLDRCSSLSYVLGAPDGPPDDRVGGVITIDQNFKGCRTIDEILGAAVDSGAKAFVQRFYLTILGRPIDPSGLDSWLNVITTQSAARVVFGLLNSAEFQQKNIGNAALVDLLYLALFDRAADPTGQSFWLGQLNAGRLVEMVYYGFLRSSEFDALSKSFGTTALNAVDTRDYNIRAFTERFYEKVFNRQPDRPGFDGWVPGLTSGGLSGGALGRNFFASQEYLRRNRSDSDFVDDCYAAFFGRPPDASGKQDWLLALANGQPRAAVVDGFIGSPEFTQLAAAYGITVSRSNGPQRKADAEVEQAPKRHAAEAVEAIPTLPGLALFGLTGLVMFMGRRRLLQG